MRTKIKILIASAASIFTFAACDVKDPIYETSHPDKGEVTVTTDWSATNITAPPPEGYTLKMGDYSETVQGTENTLKTYFIPGDYTLYACNAAEGISLTGTTAAVAASGGYLNPMPGWWYCGALPVTVKADSKQGVTTVISQQVRQLTLVIEPTGGSVDRIESITASLSGVAGSYDMEAGTHGTPSLITLAFTRQTAGDNPGKWTATVRLLGIPGSGQKLSGTITFTDGSPVDLPLGSDLTTDLASFNVDKKTPLTLGGEVETQTEAGFTATINKWERITGTGTAN